jgi:hypothetical protein
LSEKATLTDQRPGVSIVSLTRGPDDPLYLVEFMMAVRKRYYQEKIPHCLVTTERFDGDGLGRLQVHVGNAPRQAEFYLTKEACLDQKVVDEVASAISQTNSPMKVVIPNHLNMIRVFRSRRFRRAALKRFDLLIYDSSGTMIRLHIK